MYITRGRQFHIYCFFISLLGLKQQHKFNYVNVALSLQQNMCSPLFMLLSHARWMYQLLFFAILLKSRLFLQQPSKSYTEPKPVMKHWNQNCDYTNETCVQPFLCLYFMRGRGEKGQLLRFFAITLQSRLVSNTLLNHIRSRSLL